MEVLNYLYESIQTIGIIPLILGMVFVLCCVFIYKQIERVKKFSTPMSDGQLALFCILIKLFTMARKRSSPVDKRDFNSFFNRLNLRVGGEGFFSTVIKAPFHSLSEEIISIVLIFYTPEYIKEFDLDSDGSFDQDKLDFLIPKTYAWGKLIDDIIKEEKKNLPSNLRNRKEYIKESISQKIKFNIVDKYSSRIDEFADFHEYNAFEMYYKVLKEFEKDSDGPELKKIIKLCRLDSVSIKFVNSI